MELTNRSNHMPQ